MKNKALWLIFSIILLAGSIFSQIAPKPTFDSLGRRASDAAAGTCNSARKGYRYYNTTSNVWEFCNGTAWGSLGSGGSGGITVGTTTSDGTSNVVLKTSGTGKVTNSTITDSGTVVSTPSTLSLTAAGGVSTPQLNFGTVDTGLVGSSNSRVGRATAH